MSFSTANASLPAENLDPQPPYSASIEMLINAHLSPLFEATADATEEAIVDALIAAETMVGANGATALEIPLDVLRSLSR